MGKVNVACALAGILGRGPLPARIVNLGTAGALRPGLSGIRSVNTVIQHDLDADVLRTLTGISVGGPITVAASGEGLTLATGDAFIDSATDRNRLADRAHLADKEGYVLAAAASEAGVPIEIVKYVSDGTDESAAGSWRDNVAKAARSLADWAAQNFDRLWRNLVSAGYTTLSTSEAAEVIAPDGSSVLPLCMLPRAASFGFECM
jgi:adenosylhomocysteine nucleosidase